MTHKWLKHSETRDLVEKEYLGVKTLSERRAAFEEMVNFKPRAIGDSPKRFYGYERPAGKAARRTNHKNKNNKCDVFNFATIYFVGTQEEYDKL